MGMYDLDWSRFNPKFGEQIGATFDPNVIAQKQNALTEAAMGRQLQGMQIAHAIRAGQQEDIAQKQRAAAIGTLTPEEQQQVSLGVPMEKIVEHRMQQNALNQYTGAIKPTPEPRPLQGQVTGEFDTSPSGISQLRSDLTRLPASERVGVHEAMLQQGIIQPKMIPRTQDEINSAITGLELSGVKGAEGIRKGQEFGERQVDRKAAADLLEQGKRERLQEVFNQQKFMADLVRGATPKVTYNADARGFIEQPSAQYPQGRIIPLQGITNTQMQSDKTGSEFLQTLEKPQADQVKALAEGRMAFPAGFALKSPYWQDMVSKVSQYDPSFDAVNYSARSQTRNDFTKGPSANNVTALNTAIQHLGKLSDAYDKLGNTDYPAYNTVSNYLGNQFGNKEVQKNFAAVATDSTAVAHELAKVFRQSGMSEGEIKSWESKISTSAGPEQSKQVIKSALDLMEGRLQALGVRYNQGMGTTKQPYDLLTPEAQQTWNKLSGNANPSMDMSSPQTRTSTKPITTSQTVTSPQDIQAINWAKGNPNDPRSQKILALHGVSR